jgi:hypothetical protein
MNEAEILPAPVISSPTVGDDTFRSEQQAFYRLLPELLETHRGQYVAIHGGRVVGIGSDGAEVARAAYATFGYIPIYVELVAKQQPRPIRLGIYRDAPADRRP